MRGHSVRVPCPRAVSHTDPGRLASGVQWTGHYKMKPADSSVLILVASLHGQIFICMISYTLTEMVPSDAFDYARPSLRAPHPFPGAEHGTLGHHAP